MQKISLPIDSHLHDVLAAFDKNESVILTAPPGSGKTTRTPHALLKKFKKILVLVPRRIAAVSTAARISEETDQELGTETGYQVRFESRMSANTRLIFMTEGLFIKKINDADLWKDLELVIFDEFHERSSHLDLALGICLEKQILEQNPKILVMSATLNTSTLQDYLGTESLIDVETPPHPLEIVYSKKSQRLACDFQFADLLADTLVQAVNKSKKDVLVFLPGLGEIRFIERSIQSRFSAFEICILHGSVQLAEQKRILQPSNRRRIILSTNVAESSITIPSVDCVVDSGLEKKAVTEGKIGFRKLELKRISHFSAKQRAGRAARTGPGTCYRLWHELDERSMDEQIEPEILRSDLLEESLTLLSAGIKNPDQFSWLDRPGRSFKQALNQLRKWELIDNDNNITPKGQQVQNCPLDIERGLLFVELARAGWQKPAATFLAFLETTNFDKLTSPTDLDDLFLTDMGRRIENQLARVQVKPERKSENFRSELIELFFKYFPHRIAKRREGIQAVSSLGRGVELTNNLVDKNTDYFLLLSGREYTAALTKCDFAIGLTTAEFEKHSRENTVTSIDILFDAEKKRLYKIERRTAGNFVVNESAKAFLNEKESREYLPAYLEKHFSELLEQHPHFNRYNIKLNFIKKKSAELGLSDFGFAEQLTQLTMESVIGSIASMEEFFSMNLFDILLFHTPDDIKKLMRALPDHFTLPQGKVVDVDYESEQAPKISARMQEFYNLAKNPTVLDGKVRMTIELLAPNYRPTQVTSQLENFWKTSYFEIRKELKARYPRHAWPEDPLKYVPEPRRK